MKFTTPGYPPIMASMIVSSVTGASIKDLREKIFTVASELSESAGKKSYSIRFLLLQFCICANKYIPY